MKLYEVPNNSYVRVTSNNPRLPLGATKVSSEDLIHFHHIDGMYSYCHNSNGEVVHLVAWQEVELVEPEWEEAQ